MNHILTITGFKRRAHEREAGYVEEALRIGKVAGNIIELTPAQFNYLRKTFNPHHKPDPGLGARLLAHNGPISHAVQLPCFKNASCA